MRYYCVLQRRTFVIWSLNHVQFFGCTVAHKAPLSMGFPRQEYWRRLPLPSSGDLLDSGVEPASPALGGGLFTTEPPGKHSERSCRKSHGAGVCPREAPWSPAGSHLLSGVSAPSFDCCAPGLVEACLHALEVICFFILVFSQKVFFHEPSADK